MGFISSRVMLWPLWLLGSGPVRLGDSAGAVPVQQIFVVKGKARVQGQIQLDMRRHYGKS